MLRVLAVIFIIYLNCSAWCGILDVETFFTKPKCFKHIPIKHEEKHEWLYPKDVFCTQADKKINSQMDNTPLKKIVKLILDPNVTKIQISTFKLSNEEIIQAICSKLKNSKVSIELFIHMPKNKMELMNLENCQTNEGQFKMKDYIPTPPLAIFHAKYMIFSYANTSDKKILFSSGNLSSATFLKHENWNLVKTSDSTNFYKKHLCHIQALNKNKNELEMIEADYLKCISKLIESKSPITPYFIPGESATLIKRIIKSIRDSNEILLASHQFGPTPIYEELKRHLKKGRRLKIYLDNGHILTVFGKVSFQIFASFNYLFTLQSLGAEIIPIYTNQKSRAFFHNKILIMDRHFTQDKAAMILGSGNFTNAAMLDRRWSPKAFPNKLKFWKERTKNVNIENFYYILYPHLISQYKDYLRGFDKKQPLSTLSKNYLFYNILTD